MADKDRSAAPMPTGDLGEGTPANVDIHKLGQSDRPEEAWGEPAEGAVHGANHTRRPERTEAARGQGPLTRERGKQINTRGP
jgi:hypothetical protein